MARKNRKKRGKTKKSKHADYRTKSNIRSVASSKLWITSFVSTVIISIPVYYYIAKLSLKTPPEAQHIQQLQDAITNLHSTNIETLISQYNFDFNEEIISREFEPVIDHFFLQWIQQIHDDQYTDRLHILKLLLQHTNIHDQTEICICNQAIQYRLMDAMELILSCMHLSSINKCFMHKTDATNNSIFHTVTKSKSASFARLILKWYNNPKLQIAAERLHIDIKRLYSNRANTDIVLQNDINQIQSHLDIEMVIKYAQKANMNSDWFYATNSENYTGFDYWMYFGTQNPHKLLSDYTAKQPTKNIAQSVTMEDCDLDQELFFKHSCAPHIIYDWNDFDIYWKQQRPVIIRGTLLNTNDVTFDALIRDFGDLSIMVSEIPYATLFGMEAWRIPIKEYIDIVLNGAHDSNLYAFDKILISMNKELRDFFNFTIPFMEGHEIRSKYKKIYQLALGPQFSGAPPHWHQSAFNVLYEGKKMWWMFTPKSSMYTAMNVVKWINTEYKHKLVKNREVDKHYCFIQQKGDIVFVPSYWSHAVQNMESSLAVAIETEY